MKKHLLCTLLCVLCASSALAAPAINDSADDNAPKVAGAPKVASASKISEVRLNDYPGYGPNGHLQSEFVFRADGSFYWVKGLGKDAIRQKYTLKAGEFQKVAAALEAQQFFALKPYYPEGPMIADAASLTLSATRGGQKKSVIYVRSDQPGSQPSNLWTLEKVLRGVAMETINPEPARVMN